MQAHEVLRAAAKILKDNWNHGVNASGHPINVWDHDGKPLLLWHAGSSGKGIGLNPAAAKFSLYGAVAAAVHSANPPAVDTGVMWQELSLQAAQRLTAVSGGSNHVHAIAQFNETPGRTSAEVVDLVEACADVLEATKSPPRDLTFNPFAQPEPPPLDTSKEAAERLAKALIAHRDDEQ